MAIMMNDEMTFEEYFANMRKNDLKELGLPDTATDEEIRLERTRVEFIKKLKGKVPDNATWDDLYAFVTSLNTPYLEPAMEATEWWVKVLTFDPTDPLITDYIGESKYDFELAMLQKSYGGLPKEKEMMFRTLLIFDIIVAIGVLEKKNERLIAAGYKEDTLNHEIYVRTDYGPTELLEEVRRKADLYEGIFPVKTNVTVTKDKVIANRKVIYERESDQKSL